MVLSHQIAARVLGVTLADDVQQEIAADRGFIGFDAEHRLEYAARARAIERWPLRPSFWAFGAELPVNELPREGDRLEPNDGGSDGCPPAAVRHIAAGALVASLVTGMGFAYGDPPWLPLGAGPIRPNTHPAAARDMIAAAGGDPFVLLSEPIPEEATQATRGRYGVAECVVQALLGVSSTRDPEGPSNDRTPEAVDEAAIDLAIDMLCDESHHVAEIVAGAAAWLLATQRQPWAAGRARRMCSVVGVRFPS